MAATNGVTSDTVCSMIANIAKLHSRATAVESGQFQLTYSQLSYASHVFSQRLAYYALQKADFVACCGNRSPAMVVAMLGVLKSSACIVPIDTETWGQHRIGKTVKIAAPKLIVCTTDERLESDSKIPVLHFPMKELEKLLTTEIENGVHESPRLQPPNGDDLAYTVFTSGTTGAPKGVMIRHSSLVHYVQQNDPDAPFNLNARVGSRVLLLYSVAFDACLGVIFSTICNGGSVVLATSTNYTDIAKSCTILPLTPSILATFGCPTYEYENVESIFLGGESPAPQIINPWFNGSRRLFNCYGPTEATCASLIKELFPGSAPNILQHTVAKSTVILVRDGCEDAGEEGEILISGPGLALGYLGNKSLTDCKFKMLKGTRYYFTGDYGRQIGHGIQFMGRKDRTVKNRGFLINLDSEVEQPLSAIAGVGAVAAFMHDGHLVAFLTPEKVDVATIKSQLQQNQDSFSIPERIYTRAELPLTANGKADIAALRTILDGDFLAPAKKGGAENDNKTKLGQHTIVKRGFCEILSVPMASLDGESSFLALGGNSLSAVGMVSYFRRQGYICQVQHIFQMGTIEKISRVLVPANNETMSKSQLATAEEQTSWGLNSSDGGKMVPMGAVQMKMIQSTILQPTLNYIKADMLFKHPGTAFDTSRFRQAWVDLCHRHSIFRLEFVLELEMAVVHNSTDFEWTELKYSSQHEWQAAVEQADYSWTNELEPLDPDRPRPKMKLSCYTQSSELTRFSWVVHHSLVDGWSVPLILKELSSLLNGQPLPAAPQFAAASIEQKRLRNHPREEALQLWRLEKEKLSSVPRIGLPKPCARSRAGRRLQITRRLGIPLQDIQELARKCLVSDMAVYLTAWGLVLSRYCGSDKVVCGAVLAGRNLPVDGADCIVGPLLGTVPVAMDFPPHQATGDAMFQIHENLHRINEFQWEFEKLASALPNPPVLETLVSLQYGVPVHSWRTTDTFPAPSTWQHTETTELPIHVLIDVDDTCELEVRLLVDVEFCNSFYASQIMDHYVRALRALPLSSTVSNVMSAMFGQLEMNKLLFSFPDLHQPYHGPRSLKDAFEATVDSWPDLIALQTGDQLYTYSKLDKSSNILAARLAEVAGPGDVVAILADGSPEWIISILAVLKVGAAYCPVDISLPVERIDTILTESQSKGLLKSSSNHSYRGSRTMPTLTVQEVLSSQDMKVSARRPPTRSQDRDSAVIIFTSGSTGKPKGIPLEHIGILSLLDYPNARLRSGPGRKNAQFLSLGFDCCVNEIFATLCHGATLVLKNAENPMSHLAIVDAAMCTPSFLSTLDPVDFPSLKLIALAGEPVPQKLVDSWGHGRTLLNVYSPTECTISAVYPELQPDKPVTLGRPVPRMALYVLDEHLCPCPVGVTGEIYLSGIQVTKGYLNLEVENRKRFIANPWVRGWTMYKSGDRGRLTEEYEVECLGRCDNQVKVRGYRVELEEIEAAMLSVCSDVIQAVAVAHGDTLVAFVSPATVDRVQVSSQLNKRLPAYCQPSTIIATDDIPMTANQKIDRRGLALSVETYLRDGRQLSSAMQLATGTEKAIQKIWKDVTGCETSGIGQFDRFDHIGGHSLLYQRVIRQIYAELGVRVPFRVVVKNQALGDLAASIDEIGIDGEDEMRSVAMPSKLANTDRGKNSTSTASDLEREMYLMFKVAANPATLNMVYTARVADLDVELFTKSVSSVLYSNEILRSRFVEENGQVVKKIEPPSTESVTSELVTDATVKAASLANQALDPTDSLVKAYILQDKSNSPLVVVILSHLVGDRASLSEMLAAIETGYNWDVDGLGSGMPQQIISSSGYCRWAEHNDDQKVTHAQAIFWDNFTANCSPSKPVFGQFDASKAVYGSLTIKIDEVTTAALDRVQADASLSGHQLATVLIGLTVAGLKGRETLLIAAPFRDSTSILLDDDRFGLFLDRVVIPLQFDSSSATDMWQMVKDASDKAISNFLPFAKLKQSLGLSGKANALCEIVVTYHDQPMRSLRLLRTGVRDFTIRPRGVKFPLLFEVSKFQKTLQIDIDYDASIIGAAEAERIAASLTSVLQDAGGEEPPKKIRKPQTVGSSYPVFGSQSLLVDNSDQDTVNPPLVETVRAAMARCLGLEISDVGASTSFFDIGATSVDSLLLRHLLGKEGINVTLGAILGLGTARLIAGSATLLE